MSDKSVAANPLGLDMSESEPPEPEGVWPGYYGIALILAGFAVLIWAIVQ